MTEDDVASAYWDREIRPMMVQSGVPSDALAWMRLRYTIDATANPMAMQQLLDDYHQRTCLGTAADGTPARCRCP